MTEHDGDAPWLVRNVKWTDKEWNQRALNQNCLMRGKFGDFVSIRPCDEALGDKTFLGVMLGDLATSVSAEYDPGSKTLEIGFSLFNPAMFVPDLNRVLLGRESWWTLIESPEDLRKISDADIDNVWYVRALKAMTPP